MSKMVRVYGTPVTQGSMNVYAPGRAVDRHSKALKPWRKNIAEAYREQDGTFYPKDTPVFVDIYFYIKRPRSVSVKKRPLPSTKLCDIDKLTRAVLDALTGVAYFDDCQVCSISCTKEYDDDFKEGVAFSVTNYKETEI